LIVDDEPAVRELMARWVSALGLQAKTACNAEEALQVIGAHHFDLAVIDVMMPGHDGLWLAGEMRRDHPDTAVVIATAYTELLGGTADAPIADLLIKPFKRERFVLAVDRGRDWRRQTLREIEWQAQLSLEVSGRVQTICQQMVHERARGFDDASTLTTLAEERTPDVVAHSERVVRYTGTLARQLGLDEHTVWTAERAAQFHDIGKIAIPESLLGKPSPLTRGEVAIMQRHVDAGADILDTSESLRAVAPIVRASHEWFGGGGYPAGLAGNAIPIASRIVAVTDAYDAMTEDRVYRHQLDSAEAISELLRCAPSQFDPEIVTSFLSMLERQ
jgi:putative nucleotidyltransferase with HDIG domain